MATYTLMTSIITALFHDQQLGCAPGIAFFSFLTYLVLTIIGRFTLLQTFDKHLSHVRIDSFLQRRFLLAPWNIIPFYSALRFMVFSLLSVFSLNRWRLLSKLQIWDKMGLGHQCVRQSLNRFQWLFCFIHNVSYITAFISILYLFLRILSTNWL